MTARAKKAKPLTKAEVIAWLEKNGACESGIERAKKARTPMEMWWRAGRLNRSWVAGHVCFGSDLYWTLWRAHLHDNSVDLDATWAEFLPLLTKKIRGGK